MAVWSMLLARLGFWVFASSKKGAALPSAYRRSRNLGPFVRQTSLSALVTLITSLSLSVSLCALSLFYNHSQHHDEITIRMCIQMLNSQHSSVLFFFTSKITTTHCLSQAGRGIHVKEFRSEFQPGKMAQEDDDWLTG